MNKLSFLLAACFIFTAQSYGVDPEPSFNPKLFAFENGVKFGTTEKQIAVLQKLGYDSLGSAKPRDLAARLKVHKESNLRISSIYIGGKLGNKIKPEIPKAIGQLKGRDSIIELFVQGNSKNTDEQAVAFVQEVADLAKVSKLRVVLYPHAGFYIDTLDDAIRIAKLSKRSNVGVMFNLCHFLKVEPTSNLRETLESAGDLLWRVSICGAEVGGSSWSELIQPLDKGSFDQAELLNMLREIGFSGDIGLQCYAIAGDPEENLNRSMIAWRSFLGEK